MVPAVKLAGREPAIFAKRDRKLAQGGANRKAAWQAPWIALA